MKKSLSITLIKKNIASLLKISKSVKKFTVWVIFNLLKLYQY